MAAGVEMVAKAVAAETEAVVAVAKTPRMVLGAATLEMAEPAVMVGTAPMVVTSSCCIKTSLTVISRGSPSSVRAVRVVPVGLPVKAAWEGVEGAMGRELSRVIPVPQAHRASQVPRERQVR